ncbi:hypothetical protein DFO70_1117 [Cytobacillus firmus]|uniref:Uncharacterized protein n=2 Tax=Cytobacillus TaxID=2675230 RepID=A0A366JN50_CYTFI|nr:hypothetical protein DFO70_1117 [Cytobacillus firmus]TDX47413.1 hypothetical protein DFO72_101510 [Cytobacillus oceanisediminis]
MKTTSKQWLSMSLEHRLMVLYAASKGKVKLR